MEGKRPSLAALGKLGGGQQRLSEFCLRHVTQAQTLRPQETVSLCCWLQAPSFAFAGGAQSETAEVHSGQPLF